MSPTDRPILHTIFHSFKNIDGSINHKITLPIWWNFISNKSSYNIDSHVYDQMKLLCCLMQTLMQNAILMALRYVMSINLSLYSTYRQFTTVHPLRHLLVYQCCWTTPLYLSFMSLPGPFRINEKAELTFATNYAVVIYLQIPDIHK